MREIKLEKDWKTANAGGNRDRRGKWSKKRTVRVEVRRKEMKVISWKSVRGEEAIIAASSATAGVQTGANKRIKLSDIGGNYCRDALLFCSLAVKPSSLNDSCLWIWSIYYRGLILFIVFSYLLEANKRCFKDSSVICGMLDCAPHLYIDTEECQYNMADQTAWRHSG